MTGSSTIKTQFTSLLFRDDAFLELRKSYLTIRSFVTYASKKVVLGFINDSFR